MIVYLVLVLISLNLVSQNQNLEGIRYCQRVVIINSNFELSNLVTAQGTLFALKPG